MKTNCIKIITLEDLKQYTDLVVYTSESVTILNDMNKIIHRNHHVAKLGCMMMVFCEEGETNIRINGNIHLLQKGNCAILTPGTIIQSYTNKHDFTSKIFAVSQRFLTETLSLKKETWNVLHYLYHHPIFPINRDTSYKMYLYKELGLALIQEKTHAYSQRTRSFHLAGMLCEMFAMINQLIPENKPNANQYNRGTLITRDFIELVNADNGTHRSVAYYADKLCYSPKYLSSVIKDTTGKTPMQFIQENTIKHIKYKLRHSSMSIKEIADSFNFPNASFFGKFVKLHTGMTPIEYRLSKEEEA
jgi:AraC-like DNA-binding protein